jgi:hypothetical protein
MSAMAFPSTISNVHWWTSLKEKKFIESEGKGNLRLECEFG